MSDPHVLCEGVHKAWPRPNGAAHAVLRGVDLRVDAGESVAIVGPSGSGKSTLLGVLGTIHTPDAGRVVLGGQPADEMSHAERARLRHRHLGFVFQTHRLLPQCTALENVLVAVLAEAGARVGADERERARGLLGAFGLQDRLDHRPGALSVGECQRVAVARALMMDPPVILADEPTGSLDAERATRLANALYATCGSRARALIIATHDRLLAERADRVLELSGGLLREVG